jgi:hypothetical protein
MANIPLQPLLQTLTRRDTSNAGEIVEHVNVIVRQVGRVSVPNVRDAYEAGSPTTLMGLPPHLPSSPDNPDGLGEDRLQASTAPGLGLPPSHSPTSSSSSHSSTDPLLVISQAEYLPPPYVASRPPDFPAPAYEVIEKPATLAQQLYRFGFGECSYLICNRRELIGFSGFPLVWVLGAFILVCDLRPVPEAECGRTTSEQVEALALLRKEELEWAWKCLYAFILFCVLVAVVVVVALMAIGIIRL